MILMMIIITMMNMNDFDDDNCNNDQHDDQLRGNSAVFSYLIDSNFEGGVALRTYGSN